ncbi:MAG: DUF3857 domain-containing protein [Bacteroidetes bacterium]|jgi:hypothetical protein|nr:DUF3857 domain-containing protein [Bacteroidota bacterium]
MKTLFTLLLAGAFSAVYAQTSSAPAVQPYGKVDIADLELKACDFEKDANAEVLFEKGNLSYSVDVTSVELETHTRIKIFNENGKEYANIHLQYYSGNHLENITGLEAETINLVDGKAEITKVDKKSFFNKQLDKNVSEIAFTFPNVKSGSIIEFRYKLNINRLSLIPTWDFQKKIPVKYSEYDTSIPEMFYFRPDLRLYQPMVKNTSVTDSKVLKVLSHEHGTYSSSQESETIPYNVQNEVRAVANVPSLPNEPYMSSFEDNVQHISLNIASFKPLGGFNVNLMDTWAKVGGALSEDDDFGGQLKRSLSNEQAIINEAYAHKTTDDKIAYVFNQVKNLMKWNSIDRWYTIDGTSKAWDNKTGNSAEINLILYHLLKQCGINAYPMVVSTQNYGRVNPFNTTTLAFNRAVVYVLGDNDKKYVLDATGKYNQYNETPTELLNSMGLWIDRSKNTYDTVYVTKETPVRQSVLINAEIKPDGKIQGTAQLNSFSYNRIDAIKRYKEDGEKKYIDYLADGDNNLKISSVKFENMDVDTLPLTQKVDFDLDLAGSDQNYIYLNPNLFSSLKKNPLLNENRMSDVDFEYLRGYSINGVYKIPAGYKVDALPKDISLVMPDKGISFKRIIAEQEGSIMVRYSVNYNKIQYSKDDYPSLHEFYKKMYEMLNEQIVLKKS